MSSSQQAFERLMRQGEAQYRDVLDALAAVGHRATFTQTGGMNAGLEILLEDGWALLVTGAEDSLAWVRTQQVDWGVALYAPEERYDGAPRVWATAGSAGVATLERLVTEVLRTAAGPAGVFRSER